MRWKMSEEQNKGRGTKGAFDQERETHDQRWESESREWQEYAREREEEIEYQQSEPYLSPMSESDPPTRPVSPLQRDGTKAKTKVSMSEYRSRQLQQEAAREREERDRESERLLNEEQCRQRESIEFQKLELAHRNEIEIQQVEIARIKYEQEQLRLEQEHLQKEQEANAKLVSQARHTPVAFGSHTPCLRRTRSGAGLPWRCACYLGQSGGEELGQILPPTGTRCQPVQFARCARQCCQPGRGG